MSHRNNDSMGKRGFETTPRPEGAKQPMDSKQTADVDQWLQQIDWWHRRLQPKLPDIDPHDLRMMLRSLLQPKSVKRRWLLRKTKEGRYVL